MARGRRPLVVNFDEARPADDRRSVWAVYMARGLWEPIMEAPDSFAVHEPLWAELAAARRFVESMPFEEMFPANWLLSDGSGFCLAKPGAAYGVYLPAGGAVALDAPEGSYDVAWYDPRAGRFLDEQSISGQKLALAAPDEQDWAVRVIAQDPKPSPPSAASARARSLRGAAVEIKLALWDADPPATYDVEIVNPPSHGSVSGVGPDRVYTPATGFTGEDRFGWRAVGDGWQSNTAAVVIYANASGENARPQVEHQRVRVQAGGEELINLRYTDPDGPGPHFWTIRKPPEHGTLDGTDNDVLYTPEQGFTGTDSFAWAVSDGLSRSPNATVTLVVQQ